MKPELAGEIELADGEAVTIPRPDEVYPTFGVVNASLDVAIEQDCIRMKQQGLETELSLAGPHRSIEDARPVATLFTGISSIDEDDTYAEVAFDSLGEIRELRDALTLLLRYHDDSEFASNSEAADVE